MPPRRSRATDTASRTALLDAAEQLMLEEGYAAVSSRRVAARADLDPAVVYYYFGTMDELFIELFRRSAERSLKRQEQALGSPQPLWRLWEVSQDQIDTALLLEFTALANHRKMIKAEISSYSNLFHRRQIEIVAEELRRRKVGHAVATPEALVILVTGMANYLQLQEAFDNEVGRAGAIGYIEDLIRKVEGDRQPAPEADSSD